MSQWPAVPPSLNFLPAQTPNLTPPVDADPPLPERRNSVPNLDAAHLRTTPEAAEYIGVTPRTLEVWRSTKRHTLPYIKVGRLVKYRQRDLDAWLDARTIGAHDVEGQ